jgi:hypothetical protein
MNRILYSLFLFIIFFLSCRNPFAPAKAGDEIPVSFLITQQKSPEEVLENFRYAYTFKDSLVYSEVLNDTFIFISVDYKEYPPQPLNWGRDIELKTTGRMFRFFSNLDLTFNNIVFRDTLENSLTDNLPKVIDQKITYTLTLDGGRSIPPLNGEVIFRFIRRKEKWYISRWEDQRI